MIGWLNGRIVDKQQTGKLVLNVHGVGYEVETSLNTFFQVSDNQHDVALYIHTVVREDAFLLYGFLQQEERALFRALIKVNGVGPKLAIAILSSITPQEFTQCIYQENAALLSKIPGIGKKTSERLIIEMRDGLKQLGPALTATTLLNHANEAVCALESLGYKSQEALKIVNKLDDGTKNCEQLIREALQALSKVAVV